MVRGASKGRIVGEMGEIEPEGGVGDRVAPRTNLLLAATAEVGGRSLPVRIRNLSETGAMVDGAGLPEAGMPADPDARRSPGLRDRRLGRRRPPRSPVRRPDPGQRMDRRQAQVDRPHRPSRPEAGRFHPGRGPGRRRDRAALCARRPTRAAGRICPISTRGWPTSSATLQRLLEGLGDELIADLLLIQRHGKSLQSLDRVGQILGHVSAILRADDKAAMVEEIGMEDLRARLKRKSIG